MSLLENIYKCVTKNAWMGDSELAIKGFTSKTTIENYTNQFLKVRPNQKPELKSIRRFIRTSFSKLECFLMPYPGKLVARTRTYDGHWSKMDEDFLSAINLVIPSLLAPDNLVVKKVNGVEMTSQSFNQLLQSPDESVVVSTTDQ